MLNIVAMEKTAKMTASVAGAAMNLAAKMKMRPSKQTSKELWIFFRPVAVPLNLKSFYSEKKKERKERR